MSEVSEQANAIVLAASLRMVALCTKASQNHVNGIEAKKQFYQAHRILTLLKAYRHSNDMNAYESDALLYCLKKLSDASSFPTTNPIVGQSLTINTILFNGNNVLFYNQGIFIGMSTQIDFESIVASISGGVITVSPSVGTVILIGDFDASLNLFPSGIGTGAAGLVKKGNAWNINNPGILGGEPVEVEAMIIAKIDNPGQTLANWKIIP